MPDLFSQLFSPSSKTTNTGTSATTSTGNSATTGTQNQTSNTSQNQTTTGNTNSSTTQNQVSAGSSQVSTLDEASKAALTSLLAPLLSNASNGAAGGAGTNSAALTTIAQQFSAKAGTESGLVQNATDAAVNKAKSDFTTGEGAQVNQVAQQIGSTGNTYSQEIKANANNDLITQIANITAQGQLSASSLQNQDLQSAISAFSTASTVSGQDANTTLAPLLQVISLLKGADTTSTQAQNTAGTSSTGSTTNETSLSDQIAQIVGSSTQNTTQSGTQDTNTTGTQKSNSSAGILNDILSIF